MEKLIELVGKDVFEQHIKPKLKEGANYFFGEGEFIPKSRFDEVNNQVKDHKNQIAERDKQLEELKKLAKGNEELTKKFEDLQATYTKEKQEYEAKIQKQEYDFAFQTELSKHKAKDIDLLKAKIDNTKITFKDGKFYGLNEQIEGLKKTHAYIFEEASNPIPPRGGAPIIPGGIPTKPGMGNPAPVENPKPWNKHKHGI